MIFPSKQTKFPQPKNLEIFQKNTKNSENSAKKKKIIILKTSIFSNPRKIIKSQSHKTPNQSKHTTNPNKKSQREDEHDKV